MFYSRRGVKTITADVTSTSVTNVIPAVAGLQYMLVGLFATNNEDVTNSIKVFKGDQSITPDMPIGASGTFIWDAPGDGQFTGAIGSGIGVALGNTGDFTVSAHYIVIDKSTPITKDAARAASLRPITTRTPDAFGN